MLPPPQVEHDDELLGRSDGGSEGEDELVLQVLLEREGAASRRGKGRREVEPDRSRAARCTDALHADRARSRFAQLLI